MQASNIAMLKFLRALLVFLTNYIQSIQPVEAETVEAVTPPPATTTITVDKGTEEEERQDRLAMPNSEYVVIDVNNATKSGVTTEHLYIQHKEPLFRLAMEYAIPALQNNVFMLRNEGVKWIARTRGDGNCFYRALAFHLFYYVFINKTARNHSLRPIVDRWKLKKRWRSVLKNNLSDQFDNHLTLTFELFMSALQQFEKLENEHQFMEFFNHPGYSQPIVSFLRTVTALELLERQNEYAPYVLDSTIHNYVLTRVLPMDKDAEQLEIIALTSSLSKGKILADFNQTVQVTIMRLDGQCRDLQEFSYSLNQTEDQRPVKLVQNLYLLYRPGHYDVLL